MAGCRWPLILEALGAAIVLAGGIAVFTSVMIYATLGREYWTVSRTAFRFLLTTALLGTATVWLSVAILAIVGPSLRPLICSAWRANCAVRRSRCWPA